MKILFLVLIFVVYPGIAQVNDTHEEGAEFQTGNMSAPFLRVTTESGNKVVGSEYLNEEWEQAIITDLAHKKKIKLLARFNAYTKEIELLKEKDVAALKPVEGLSVELYNKKFVPLKIDASDNYIFAEQLVRGKMSLYRVYDAKVNKAASDASLLGLDNEDKLVIVDKLYWQNENGEVNTLPNKKKQLENMFDGATLKYVKKEKLSLKKEEDLIRVFDFHNTTS